MTSPKPSRSFKFDVHPIADPHAVFTLGHARFTVLTPRLIRMEFDPQGQFEDRASQAFWFRRQPVPEFKVQHSETHLEIKTQYLRLQVDLDDRGFTSQSLQIELLASQTTWHYGDRDRGNLFGTARTLDDTNGRVSLGQGLMSRDGWVVVDDTRTLVFNEEGWLEPRDRESAVDLYFFGFERDFLGCLADLTRVAGSMPMIPRWALGNWWSRFWAYTADELTQLVEDFKAHRIPLDVCVIDMDWHVTKTGNSSSGWTGFTWNRELFPDPPAFLQKLHDLGVKTTLNLHPAEGIHPHEEVYPALAKAMGIDPAGQHPVDFDVADPKFMRIFFDQVIHPLEGMGVDFWWMDWQQGDQSKLKGLDPLWWLNHLFFEDMRASENRRPLIFSRWGGLGNHRYAIGFSGDTICTWDSLALQPSFTANAANVGYGWWSHDIGGHMLGKNDPETYTRWVQYGVFSPIFRLHSTNNPYNDRRPWSFGDEVLRITRDAMQLRHALTPYIYSMAWQSVTQSRPLVLPVYYLHAEEEAAYHCPNQYYFGSELLAAPYILPRDPATRLSKQTFWLPEGDWFNFFSGEHFTGGRYASLFGKLEDIPVLAKAGAIVPLGPRVGWGGLNNPSELELYIFPGADNTFTLYEDDGRSQEYCKGKFCTTLFSTSWQPGSLTFKIAPAQGDTSLVPAQRLYTLHLRGINHPYSVSCRLNGEMVPALTTYDPQTETLTLKDLSLSVTDTLELTLQRSGSLTGGRDRRAETMRWMLHAFDIEADTCWQIDHVIDGLLDGTRSLDEFSYLLRGAQLDALRSALQNQPVQPE